MTNPTPQQVDQILEKLATDDAFRAQFEADPVGTLATMGVTLDATQISATPKLPSKDAVAKIRADLASGNGDDSFVVFFLKG
jgi:putative modified peptide